MRTAVVVTSPWVKSNSDHVADDAVAVLLPKRRAKNDAYPATAVAGDAYIAASRCERGTVESERASRPTVMAVVSAIQSERENFVALSCRFAIACAAAA